MKRNRCPYTTFKTPNHELRARRLLETSGKNIGFAKDYNINHYGYDLDMEVYGIWLEACDIVAIRSSFLPREILDDFYYEHKGKFDEP